MPVAELNETSTSEEVQSYVENVVEDVKAERAGTEKGRETRPEKSDAEITGEHADNEHETPVAEKKPGDDANAKKGKGEKSGTTEVETAQEWLDDDLKAEVAAYGIEESELADFASREELDRALRIFDKSALEAGKKSLEGEGGQVRNEKGQFEKKQPEKAEAPKAEIKPALHAGRHEIALNKDVYDEEIVNEFNRLRDHYEARFEALESRLLESDAAAEEQRFDSAIDKLDMPKLFGTTGKETADELKKRADVLSQVKVLQAGFRTFGRDVEIETLVSRAAPMVFSADFDKHKLKQQTRKISRQSNSRQGGGATRPQDARETPRDEAERLYKELERA